MKKQEICAVFLSIFIVEVWCSSGHPNVLLLIVDDLRPALGCYDDDLALTPNIDALAQEGTVFTRAYAQQALCGPSRTSFLTSRRPDTTKLYDVHSYWRKHAGNFTTLPQYFKDHGYHTASAGKIFHPGIVSNHSDDQPYSWSEEPYHPPTQAHKMDPVCLGADGSLHTSIYCPVQVEEQPGGSLPDIETTSFAVRWLKRRAAQNLEKHHNNISADPFFLAVGYHKPHIPLKFPAQFLDLYPISSVPLAPNPHLPSGLPPVAWNPWNDLRWRADIKALNISFPYGPMPDDYARYIRQGYYAATTYTDSLIGDVLETINSLFPDTIIAFIGDHGWSLGEHQEWSKFSNFEVATRVPFIISRWRHRNIPFKGFTSLFPKLTNPKKRNVKVKSQRKEKPKSKISFGSRNQLFDAPVEIVGKSSDRGERTRYLTPKSYFSWNKWLPSPYGFTPSKLPDISMKIKDKTEKQRKSTPSSDFDRRKWKLGSGTTRTVSHSGLVELVDLFPTLVDLAGLYALPTCPHDSRLIDTCTEGSSMSPLLNLLWSDTVPQALAEQEGMQNGKQRTFNRPSDILSDQKATRNSEHRHFNCDGLSKDIVDQKTIQSSKQFSFIENAEIDLAATLNDKQYLDIEGTSISSQVTHASKEHSTMKTTRVYSKLLSEVEKAYEVEKATHDIYQQSSIKVANMDSKLVSGISVKLAVFSQYPRPGLTPSVHPDSDQPATRDSTVMGYSMRTGRFRYTVWLPFNSSSLVPNWSRILAQELYDHHIDPQEDHNVVGHADYVPVTRSLHTRLVKGWRHSVSAL